MMAATMPSGVPPPTWTKQSFGVNPIADVAKVDFNAEYTTVGWTWLRRSVALRPESVT